ncbi:LuxR family transcriptional regulator [Aeromonas veronii]|nr:LuxR family transcriptional regulator [Aeromonas veronii]KAE9625455.1 LuxR family transcriptional regulator [Aeromonas veronii]MBW3777293.1 LuxR family transcriptional regulator [Aeromonas veronii]
MFIAEFNVARNIQAIEVSLRSLCARMGIDYFCLMIFLPSAIQRPDIRILNGCPDEWARTYREQGLWAVDPVVRKGMTQGAPILWANIIAECLDQQDDVGLAVMLEAQQHGLRDGVTLPWRGAHGQVGLLSLSTRQAHPEEQWLALCPCLAWLVTHLFEVVSRECKSDMVHRDALSLREREVCQWAAEGKQVSDIGKILGITPRTVTFHLERVIKKLGASNKNQAISWALVQGVVQLNIKTARVVNAVK